MFRNRGMRGMGDGGGSPGAITPFMAGPNQYAGQGSNGGMQGQDYAEDFYIYEANFGNLAAAATNNVNVPIQSDSDFEWMETTCFGELHGMTPPFTDNISLPIDITIVDSGSGRQLFSNPIPLSSIAGNGKQPFIMPIPRLFKANSNIQFTAQNFDAANQYDFIRLLLIGRKLFKAGN